MQMPKCLYCAATVLLLTNGLATLGDSAEVATSNAPVRMVADATYLYRLQDATKPDALVMLRRSSRSAGQQVQLYPVPGLMAVVFRNNPMPIDVVDGKLQYVALVPRERNQFDASLGLVHPDELAQYPKRFPNVDLRTIGPQEAIMGMSIGIEAERVVVHGGQLWFDIVEEIPRQYLQFIQFTDSEGDILWIKRTNLVSDKLAERWTKYLGDEDGSLPGNLVGPFHAFRFRDATYILEANGAVSLFDDQEVKFTKVGELRELRRSNLSSKHIIIHDQANNNALYVLRREGDRLVPATFTATQPDQSNPFGESLDEQLEKAILASLIDVSAANNKDIPEKSEDTSKAASEH